MKKLLLYFTPLLIILIHAGAYCQGALPEFGKISKADLLLTECPFDKGAEALELVNTENISVEINRFTGSLKTTNERWVRIKILSKTGLKNGSVVIPLPVTSESAKITAVEAIIYNIDANGNIAAQKLSKEQIFGQGTKQTSVGNDISFTFPGIKTGSVIEYKYSRIDKGSLFLPTWIFQGPLPVRFSKCTIELPQGAIMNCHVVANQPVEQDSSAKRYDDSLYNRYTWSFIMRNVPAYKTEPFMGPYKDNLQLVNFATSPRVFEFIKSEDARWRYYNNSLLEMEDFGRQFDKPVDGTGFFLDSVTGLKNKTAIIKAVYWFVKKSVVWNGEQKYYPANIDECLKAKTGSSAGMNMLLLNLLHRAGVQCYPLLVSTQENGRADRYFTTINQFNGMDVLAVDGNRSYVLDCTQQYLPFTTVPLNVLNRLAYLIDDGGGTWITVVDSRNTMHTSFNFSATMDTGGIIRGKGDMIFTGNAKTGLLIQKAAGKKSTGTEEYTGMVDYGAEGLVIDSTVKQHADDDDDTLLLQTVFHSTLQSTGNGYILNPFMFTRFIKNPFTDTTRYANIDFGGSQAYTTNMQLLLPDNFSVEEIPKSVFICMPDSAVMFTREIVSSGRKLLIRNCFTIKTPVFENAEYRGLKAFFDKVYALINEQVLVKRN